MIYHSMSWRGLDIEATISEPVKGDWWDPPVPSEVLEYDWSIAPGNEDEAFASFEVDQESDIDGAFTWGEIEDAILEDLRE